jgi:hypothetical protein
LQKLKIIHVQHVILVSHYSNKSANQLASIRKKKIQNINENKNEKTQSKTNTKTSKQSNNQKNTNNNLTNTKTFEQLNNQKNTDNNIFSFPPFAPDKTLYHQIISGAVKKMDQKNIEEAGCAMCGLLKQSCELSHLKNMKNLLHILQHVLNKKQKTKKCMNIMGLFLITHATKYVMTAICLSEKEKSLVLH